MEYQICLEKMTKDELETILNNLRLGEDHLKNILTEKQFKEFINYIDMGQRKKENIKSNIGEKAGKIGLIVNTIITSIFGAWLGIASLFELGVGTKIALFIIVFSTAILGGYIGYHAYKLTDKNEKSSLLKKKIYNLRCKVIELHKNRLNVDIKKIIKYINNICINLKADNADKFQYNFDYRQEIIMWINHFNLMIEDMIKNIPASQVGKTYRRILRFFRKNLTKQIDKCLEKTNCAIGDALNSIWERQPTPDNFFLILSRPVAYKKDEPITASNWIKKNMNHLMIAFLPTLLGIFASTFTYWGGFQALTKEYKFYQLEIWFQQPIVKIFALIIYLSITFYLAIGFFYGCYKDYLRDITLDKINKIVIDRDNELLVINKKYNFLKDLCDKLQYFIALMKLIRLIVRKDRAN